MSRHYKYILLLMGIIIAIIITLTAWKEFATASASISKPTGHPAHSPFSVKIRR